MTKRERLFMTKPSVSQIFTFLTAVDTLFEVPLSQKQELFSFAQKLNEKATICTKFEGDTIVAMVAGYTENTDNRLGYISVVATLPALQGKGYARYLVKEFLGISRAKGLDGVHLYTTKSNAAAMRLYHGLGFKPFLLPNEPRPQDTHLVCYFEKE